MTYAQRNAIITILQQHRSDDLQRAYIAFTGMSDAQMNEQYGESGKTRNEIIEGYTKHNGELEDLIQAVALVRC